MVLLIEAFILYNLFVESIPSTRSQGVLLRRGTYKDPVRGGSIGYYYPLDAEHPGLGACSRKFGL